MGDLVLSVVMFQDEQFNIFSQNLMGWSVSGSYDAEYVLVHVFQSQVK